VLIINRIDNPLRGLVFLRHQFTEEGNIGRKPNASQVKFFVFVLFNRLFWRMCRRKAHLTAHDCRDRVYQMSRISADADDVRQMKADDMVTLSRDHFDHRRTPVTLTAATSDAMLILRACMHALLRDD